jgi:hypothetical protein
MNENKWRTFISTVLGTVSRARQCAHAYSNTHNYGTSVCHIEERMSCSGQNISIPQMKHMTLTKTWLEVTSFPPEDRMLLMVRLVVSW